MPWRIPEEVEILSTDRNGFHGVELERLMRVYWFLYSVWKLYFGALIWSEAELPQSGL